MDGKVPMLQGSGAPNLDRASVQPFQFKAQERVLLSQQSKFDRRSVALLWYWRLLRDFDGTPGATAQDEEFGEAPRPLRRYAAPIAVHLYADDSNKRKWTPKGSGNETQDPQAKIGWSRAEARRVGQLLKTHDVQEGLLYEAGGEPIFVPRAEDIFFVRGEYYYEVAKVEEKKLGQTNIVTTWQGVASLARADSSVPFAKLLTQPATPLPPPEKTSTWVG